MLSTIRKFASAFALLVLQACGLGGGGHSYDQTDSPSHTPQVPITTRYAVNVISGTMVAAPTGMQVCDADLCYLEFISEEVPCNTRIGASVTVNDKLVYLSDVPFTMGTLTNNRAPGQVLLCKHYVQEVRVMYLTLERGAGYSLVKFTDETQCCFKKCNAEGKECVYCVDEPLLICPKN